MNAFLLKMACELLYAFGFIVMSLILTLLEHFGTIMLEPFDFSTQMFTTMFSAQFLNAVENILITAGISISVLILVFGLVKVFSGRLSDDVPNPFALVGRFLIAVFGAYWSIPIMIQYVFPFAQNFFNKMLNVSTGDLKTKYADPLTKLFTDGETYIAGFGSAFGDAVVPYVAEIKALIFLLVFLIFLISAIVNIIKLVVENAERYFTINVLVLAAPLAISTVTSEKAMQIFKNWLMSLISNIITIIFNILGFKLVMLAFDNCFKIISNLNFKVLEYDEMLIALISLVAISKMAQKFDQFVSMIVFRINPIQNRSLLMSAIGTIGSLDKVGGSLLSDNSPLGKLAHGVTNGVKNSAQRNPIYQALNGLVNGKRGATTTSTNGTPAYDNKLNKDGALTQTLNGDVSSTLKNNLGLPKDSDATLHSSSTLDAGGNTRIGVGDMIDAIQDNNIADPTGDKAVTPEQAQSVMNAVSGQLKDGNKIIGYDTDKREFIVGKQSKGDVANGYKTIGEDPGAMANLMNGNANVESIKVSGSDSEGYEKLKSYKNAGYYYANRGDGNFDVYLDKTEDGIKNEFNIANPSNGVSQKYTSGNGLTSNIISNTDKNKK